MAAKQQQLLPVYLALGEDVLKRRTIIDRLRKRVESIGDFEFNHDVFDGQSASGSEIAISCNTLPFASSLRLVEVSHVDKLSKMDSDVLVAYLSAPCQSTVLLLSGDKLPKNSRLYKAVAEVGKESIIDCAPMKRYELEKALRSIAVSHGFTMTSAAATKLIDLVGEDTARLDSELRKLALAHRGPDPLSEWELSNLVARTNEAKPWDFVDAFSRRDIASCLSLIPLLGSSTPYSLLAMCTNRLRELCCAQALVARGEPQKLASTLKLPEWRVKNHMTWARNFSSWELKRAFSKARDCERSMKSGSDPQSIFIDWIIEVLAR